MTKKKMSPKKCAKNGHKLEWAFGGSGPVTEYCDCGENRRTICAQCGTPWATNEGHDQTCFMWEAMHGAPKGSPLARLDALCMGEEGE